MGAVRAMSHRQSGFVLFRARMERLFAKNYLLERISR
jgi:hypothetical protein